MRFQSLSIVVLALGLSACQNNSSDGGGNQGNPLAYAQGNMCSQLFLSDYYNLENSVSNRQGGQNAQAAIQSFAQKYQNVVCQLPNGGSVINVNQTVSQLESQLGTPGRGPGEGPGRGDGDGLSGRRFDLIVTDDDRLSDALNSGDAIQMGQLEDSEVFGVDSCHLKAGNRDPRDGNQPVRLQNGEVISLLPFQADQDGDTISSQGMANGQLILLSCRNNQAHGMQWSPEKLQNVLGGLARLQLDDGDNGDNGDGRHDGGFGDHR